MSTIRSQVLAAIETVLAAASADVHPDYDALGAEVGSGIIFGEWEEDTETNNMLDRHTLSLPMGFFARGATAEAVADALQAEVHGLLMADSSFGGLVRKFRAGPVRGRKDGTGGKTVKLSQSFTAEFLTVSGSLAVAA